MVIKINFVLVAIAILIFDIIPSVYAHTAYYMKGYKIGREWKNKRWRNGWDNA